MSDLTREIQRMIDDNINLRARTAALEDALRKLRSCVQEIMDDHRDPDHADYNECEKAECYWCECVAKALLEGETPSE